jgi:L-asparaginase
MLIAGDITHAVRDVTKTSSYRTEIWNSGDLGVLGLTDTDLIRFYRSPDYHHTVNREFRLHWITESEQIPRVDIVYTYADTGPELIDASLAAGAKGLIVAGFPTGSPRPATGKALTTASKTGVAVVISNRGRCRRVQSAREFISADNLTPHKARILLILALAHKVPIDRSLKIIRPNIRASLAYLSHQVTLLTTHSS